MSGGHMFQGGNIQGGSAGGISPGGKVPGGKSPRPFSISTTVYFLQEEENSCRSSSAYTKANGTALSRGHSHMPLLSQYLIKLT